MALDEVRVQVQALAHAVLVKLHMHLSSLLPVTPQGQEAHLAGAWRHVQSHRADCTLTPVVLTATRGTDMLMTLVPPMASVGTCPRPRSRWVVESRCSNSTLP